MAQYDKLDVTPLGVRRKATAVPAAPAELDCSWLGRWSDVGWAIRIEPRLTEDQWSRFGTRAEECWSDTARNYDPLKALDLLGSLFPTHQLVVSWPRCGKIIEVPRKDKLPLFLNCGEVARHTDTHLQDVHGTRTAIARCDQHQGQL